MNWAIVFITFFLALTVLFWSTTIWQSEKFGKYINTLSILSTLALLISFMLSVRQTEDETRRREKDEDERKAQEFALETQKNWIDLERFFSDNYPYLSQLYKEIYPDNPNIEAPILTDDQQAEATAKEQHACQILAQTIEDLVLTNKELGSSDWGWQRIFQSWTGSPIFQSNWRYSKQFYNPVTVKYIDGLISGSVPHQSAKQP